MKLGFRHLFGLGVVVRFQVHDGGLARVDAPHQVDPAADLHPVPEIDLDKFFGELDFVEQIFIISQVVRDDAPRRLLEFVAQRRIGIRGVQMCVDETGNLILLGYVPANRPCVDVGQHVVQRLAVP